MSHSNYGKAGGSDEQFGSTGDTHAGLMAGLWGPAANIAVILVLYSYRKWWVYVHAAFFLLATIITLATSIPILTYTGIISRDSTITYKYSASVLNLHYLIGITCLASITLVALTGLLTKLLNLCSAKSNTILLLRKLHSISGYLVLMLCKINNYVIEDTGTMLGLLAFDVLSATMIIVWKMVFPRMEAKRITPQVKQPARKVKSIKELDQGTDYVVFANYVYDVSPLRINHPAGYQIVRAVRNKEVDRFIYGSCAADELPEVPIWSHSYKSFTLMEDPVAKIEISSTFAGFDKKEVQCEVTSTNIVSRKGHIFMISLAKKESPAFSFTKYRDINQVGRYFSLSLNDKITRLYTCVNFLVGQNLQFLSHHLQVPPQNRLKMEKGERTAVQLISEDEMRSNRKSDQIPIMFKKYPGGRFTQTVINGPISKMVIGCEKGEGLQLSHTKPGKIMIVVGGTGLYPFSDLVDLLYKQQLMLQRPDLRDTILTLSPLLADSPFKKFTFKMLAAFNFLEDIHHITLQQLLYLAERGRMDITFKFKEDVRDTVRQGARVRLAKGSFQHLLSLELQDGQQLSRVWICGPPRMNEAVSRFLRGKQRKDDFYLIV